MKQSTVVMDWSQALAIIASVSAITVGSVVYIHTSINREIDSIKAQTIRTDDKWMKADEKWERLFERLLIQDQKK